MHRETLRLSEAKVGKVYEIVRLIGGGFIKRRIMQMGLLPGVRIRVVRVAPLGDPIEINVKGYDLSIRRSEARCVIVKVIG